MTIFAPDDNVIAVHTIPARLRSVTLFSTIGEKEKSRLGQRLSLYLGSEHVCSEWGMAGQLFCVVFVFRDAGAHMIRFAIELALVFLCEMTIVLGHESLLVILQAFFSTLEPAGFCRRELAIFHSIRDSFLLIGFAAIDLVDARMSRIDLSRSSA